MQPPFDAYQSGGTQDTDKTQECLMQGHVYERTFRGASDAPCRWSRDAFMLIVLTELRRIV